jgi:hypothetical protein
VEPAIGRMGRLRPDGLPETRGARGRHEEGRVEEHGGAAIHRHGWTLTGRRGVSGKRAVE